MRHGIRFLLAVLIICAVGSSALADPIRLGSDLANTVVIPYDEEDPQAGHYSYSYCFPYADESDSRAPLINELYEYKVSELEESTIPLMADGYMDAGETVEVTETYTVTCSTDTYFSVLFVRNTVIGDWQKTRWEGNTFSLLHGEPGSTFDLTRILGILDVGAQDEFMENRQTQKAAAAVLTLVMEMIGDNEDDFPFYDDVTEEDLLDYFTPADDFYLDEDENPVFFIRPGIIADEELGFVTFPISVEDIRDEM